MALSLYSQIPVGTMYAAYRPIRIAVSDDVVFGAGSVEVLYCDIFFNGMLFRTETATAFRMDSINTPSGVSMAARIFELNLASAAQDYLHSAPPVPEALYTSDARGMARMQVNFRTGRKNSTTGLIDVGTFPETQSPEVLVVNAAVDHGAPPDFVYYLRSIRLFSTTRRAATWLYPLTHRPDYEYRLAINQNDHYPFIAEWNGLRGANAPLKAGLMVQYKQGGVMHSTVTDTAQPNGEITIYPFVVNQLPVGIPQLRQLPFIGFPADQIETYRVLLMAGSDLVFSTNWITVEPRCDDTVRVRFLNQLGGYDAINFPDVEVLQETKSGNYETPLQTIAGVGNKRIRGINRFNVRATKKINASVSFGQESSQAWASELHSTPEAYLEKQLSNTSYAFALPNPNLPAGQAGGTVQTSHYIDLIPVVVLDGERIEKKLEDRYEYQLQVSLQEANPIPRQKM